MISVFILFTVLAFLSPVSGDCGPWIPLNVTTQVPTAKDSDTIIVYNLVSALLECSFDARLSYLNGYHGGIGFRNVNSNFSISVNFDAYPTFEGAVFPVIQFGPDGNPDLIWSSLGKVFIYSGINMTFWSFGTKMVGSINGSVYNQYLKWVALYNDTETDSKFYDVFSIYTHFPMRPWDTKWMNPHECFSFAWESYRFMASLGVRWTLRTARQSIVAIHTQNAPTLISMTDPVERKLVANFYLYFTNRIATEGDDAIIDIIRDLLQNDRYYLHRRGQYYLVHPWAPFMDTLYVEVPLPPFDEPY